MSCCPSIPLQVLVWQNAPHLGRWMRPFTSRMPKTCVIYEPFMIVEDDPRLLQEQLQPAGRQLIEIGQSKSSKRVVCFCSRRASFVPFHSTRRILQVVCFCSRRAGSWVSSLRYRFTSLVIQVTCTSHAQSITKLVPLSLHFVHFVPLWWSHPSLLGR
jgi:hypothetical protein